MTVKVTVAFGFEVSRESVMDSSPRYISDVVSAECARHGVKGYSFQFNDFGVWTNAEGIEIFERGASIVAYVEEQSSDYAALREVAVAIRTALRQDCVLFAVEPVLSLEFI